MIGTIITAAGAATGALGATLGIMNTLKISHLDERLTATEISVAENSGSIKALGDVSESLRKRLIDIEGSANKLTGVVETNAGKIEVCSKTLQTLIGSFQ